MKNKDLFIVQNEKAFIMDILKRYWPKKAFEIELAEALKGEIVDTPTKPPVVDVVMKPLIKDKEMLPNMVLMPHRADLMPKKTPPEKVLLANAPNDPSLVY